jgi:hypothetical protein
MTEPRWLVLAHQLPTRSSNGRVKTWRRLQQVGAIHSRNSVYVLPNTEENREAFEWIRKEIIALKGEATVFAADALNGDDAELMAAFRRAREADYRVLKQDADVLARTMRRHRGASASSPYSKTARALRDRFTALQRIDFFGAAGGPQTVEALDAIDVLASGRPASPAGSRPRVAVTDFQHRRWVTRPRPGVDRMASAWLIRRFIDPQAEFAFAKQPADGDVAFDMYAGAFTHDGPLCTFENLVRQFGIRDAAVERLAPIVHHLDINDAGLPPPEAAAIERMIEGLQEVHRDDHALLEHGIAMFEALARSFVRSKPVQPRSRGRAPKPRRSRSR